MHPSPGAAAVPATSAYESSVPAMTGVPAATPRAPAASRSRPPACASGSHGCGNGSGDSTPASTYASAVIESITSSPQSPATTKPAASTAVCGASEPRLLVLGPPQQLRQRMIVGHTEPLALLLRAPVEPEQQRGRDRLARRA